VSLTTHTISCTSATGWTYSSGSAEFLAGGFHLKAASLSTLAATPAQATALWGRIHSVNVSVEEQVTDSAVAQNRYLHRFGVSFDGGTTVYGPAGPVLRQITDVTTEGFTAAQLRAWRAWPSAARAVLLGGQLVFIVYVARVSLTATAPDGILPTLQVLEGTTISTFTGEPTDEDALPVLAEDEYDAPYPDFPLRVVLLAPTTRFRSEDGSVLSYRFGNLFREAWDHRWNSRRSGAGFTELDSVRTFLRAHTAASFLWTAPGGTERAFVSSWPTEEITFQSDVLRVATLSARWKEVPRA